jgi:hypothetical protein
MKKIWLVLVVGLLLTACGPAATPEPTATLPPTETNTPVPPTDTPEPTATETQEPTSTPTEVVVVDFCVECHTDKDQLILTAKVEPEVESESEGVG